MTTIEQIQQVIDSPSTSFWLKAALRALLERDALDAARDAELLAELMVARLNEILPQA
ncbi:hypothetical protein [Paraburkholderia fungorum]|uniref:Uncharacterized protein n=1 Tax=Paraburkholderia fungorum TaxID=134537 RepID=A0AAW3V1P2_9BURK|nr:hypothetical protein [Paraburkholderia fungorum]MBB4517396.1 hypothetical protein [Paraburkholderia fungorum]MBB6204464.1 hypothetical protein [Paraburkholderia fungorum]